MKCETCKTELCNGDQFCMECGAAVTNADVIHCLGIRPDGTPCSAELQKDFCFCMECGQNVDQALFQKMQIECLGVMKDGSLCRKLLKEDDKFCFICETPRNVTPTSDTDVVSTSSTNDSTTSYAEANVFGMHAKLDGGNVHEGNKENISASGYPSLALTPGNRAVFGFNAPMDGEDREDEISGEPLFSGLLFPKSGSTSGNLKVFNLEANIDGKHTGLFPSSSSPDPVTFHENDLHYDPENEKAVLSSSGESASQNSAGLERILSNVTLSEEKGDELLSKAGTDVKSIHIRVDEKHSDDSSSDSSSVDCDEDEVMNPASPQSFQKKGQMLRSKRKKKPKKHKLKREKKKKKLESMKVRSHPNTQVSDLQHVQLSVTAVGHSVLLVESVDATADQMGKGSSHSTEKGKKATSGDVEERRENTNKDQVEENIESHDNVSIPEKGDDQDSQMITVERGKSNTVEEPSLSSTGEKATDFDRMEYDQSIDAALTREKNEQSAVQLKKVPGKKNADQIDSSKDRNNPDQTANQRSNRNAAPHKDPNVKVEIVVHQETEKGNTNSNQSQESKKTKNINVQINDQANGNNTVKNERERTDNVRVYFHALLSPEFNFTSADKVVVRFEVPSLGGWDSDEHSPVTLRNTEDGFVELKLLMNIPKDAIQTERGLKYKYVVIKDRPEKKPKYIWESYHYGYSSEDEDRTLALKQKAKLASIGLYPINT